MSGLPCECEMFDGKAKCPHCDETVSMCGDCGYFFHICDNVIPGDSVIIAGLSVIPSKIDKN